MNYNGTATIDFPIYRINSSGEEDEIVLTIKGRSYYDSGRVGGLPENSYPPEGDTEILEVLYLGKEWGGELTDEETKDAEEQIRMAVEEDDSSGPPSADYNDYYHDIDYYDSFFD